MGTDIDVEQPLGNLGAQDRVRREHDTANDRTDCEHPTADLSAASDAIRELHVLG